jgi:serine/threonine protein phosphatase PrpC
MDNVVDNSNGSSMALLIAHAVSHRGCVRADNEDSVLSLAEQGLWAVADGMGGHSLGALASQQVIAGLSTISFLPNCSMEQRLGLVALRLQEVSSALVVMGAQLDPPSIVGSCAVVLVVHERTAGLIWSGDSRAYRLRTGVLERLTNDHTVAGQLVKEQGLSEVQAARDPEASRLTQALGVPSFNAEQQMAAVNAADRFVLCSDGLTRCVSEAAMTQILQTHSCTKACADALLAQALNAGAPDNVSVVVVDTDSGHSS